MPPMPERAFPPVLVLLSMLDSPPMTTKKHYLQIVIFLVGKEAVKVVISS